MKKGGKEEGERGNQQDVVCIRCASVFSGTQARIRARSKIAANAVCVMAGIGSHSFDVLIDVASIVLI